MIPASPPAKPDGWISRIRLSSQWAIFSPRRVALFGDLAGDRGLLTQARIETLKSYPGLGWISALRSPAIRALVDQGHWQLSLLDRQNWAEIQSPEFPGERLMACLHPLLAAQRRRTREESLAATQRQLARIVTEARRRTRTPLSPAALGMQVGGCSIATRRRRRRPDKASGAVERRRHRAQLQGPGGGGAGLPQPEGIGSAGAAHFPPHR